MPSRLALLIFFLAYQASAGAPEFALQNLSGATVRSSDMRGKAILLEFWATWCDSCAESIPFYEKLQTRYRSNEFFMVGIAEEARAKDVASFAAKKSMTYCILLDGGRKAFDAYGVRGLPTAVLLDSDGKIRGRWVGFNAKTGADIEREIQILVKEKKAGKI